jgi:hypothetical protein
MSRPLTKQELDLIEQVRRLEEAMREIRNVIDEGYDPAIDNDVTGVGDYYSDIRHLVYGALKR